MTDKVIRVATRGSELALAQTGQLVAVLGERNPGLSFEITTIKTTGDRVTDRPLSSFRGTGVFVSELRRALSDSNADIAVHSLKDVPTEPAAGLVLAGHPKREDPHDILLCRDRSGLDDLGEGCVVGTGSPRRMVQLRAARPDLTFADLRGNLDTRIRKLDEGRYDAIAVAAAGMNRLGRGFNAASVLPYEVCLPAAGQGALAIECRKEDARSRAVAESVNDRDTMVAVRCERDVLRAVGGGCSLPIAVFARVDGDTVHVECAIGDLESVSVVRLSLSRGTDDHRTVGTELGEMMLELCAERGVRLQ